LVDLHVHSNASDGEYSPADVVSRAAAADLSAIALTDHDTIDGVAAATAAGEQCGVRVVAGCEFSVGVSWGELHLLGYFLPLDDPDLRRFLDDQRTKRVRRAHAMVERLDRAGAPIEVDAVLAEADGGTVGRPHVARVLVREGLVPDINRAFSKFLADRRPAFVAKELPPLEEVTALVRAMGGVTSAAHLKLRASKVILAELKQQGVDAVEVLHPAHDDSTAARLDALASNADMLVTGGSDWHGEDMSGHDPAPLGSMNVPELWLENIEKLHRERLQVGT
jgi:hypothetical protein